MTFPWIRQSGGLDSTHVLEQIHVLVRRSGGLDSTHVPEQISVLVRLTARSAGRRSAAQIKHGIGDGPV